MLRAEWGGDGRANGGARVEEKGGVEARRGGEGRGGEIEDVSKEGQRETNERATRATHPASQFDAPSPCTERFPGTPGARGFQRVVSSKRAEVRREGCSARGVGQLRRRSQERRKRSRKATDKNLLRNDERPPVERLVGDAVDHRRTEGGVGFGELRGERTWTSGQDPLRRREGVGRGTRRTAFAKSSGERVRF